MKSEEEEREETESLESILSDIRELGAQPSEEEEEMRREELRLAQLAEEKHEEEEEKGEEEEGENGQVTYTMKDNVQAFLMFYGIMALLVNGMILFAWAKADNEGGGANGNMIFYIVIGSNAFILLLLAFMFDWSTDEDDEDREPGFLDRLSFLYHCGRYSAGALLSGIAGITALWLAIEFAPERLWAGALVAGIAVPFILLAWFFSRRGLQVYGSGLAEFQKLDYVKNHRRSRGGHSGGGGGGGCGGGCGGCGGGE